ncbi:MAG: sugar phosphate nucleotidyltransferase [Leptolyngbyaceae cyanobacterium]
MLGREKQLPKVVGLIPAGGQATRLSPLPLSKELYPIGFQSIGKDGGMRPKVVCQYLLERMKFAGITKAFIILRSGKWDIPAYLGDGFRLGMSLGYLIMRSPHGVPYTLNQAFPFVGDSLIALGFPDILFEPKDAFVKLLKRQASSGADVVIGVFPTDQPTNVGVVDFDASGKVHAIIEKPQKTELCYMWAIAVWTPVFTHFLHDYLAKTEIPSIEGALHQELAIGDVIQAGIDQGIRVEAEIFPDGYYLDIGTPDNLAHAIRSDAW